jgi:HK97 family phage major capsid protein
MVRSQLRDPSLNIAPDEGQAELRKAHTLAASQPSGLPLRGHTIPWAALAPRADVTTRNGGPQSLRSIVLDVMAAETVLGQLGVRFQPLGSGDYNVADLAQSVTAGFVQGEGGQLDPWTGDMVASTASFDWCDIAARVDVSRRLLRQAPGIEERLRELLRNGITEAMEGGVLAGSGTYEPMGLLDPRWGCAVETWAAGVPTHAEAAATLKARAEALKQKVDRFAWLASTADFDDYLAADGRSAGEPLVRELDGGGFQLVGRPLVFTNYLPTGKTICGAFDRLVVGLYGQPQLTVNPYLNDYSISRLSLFQGCGSVVGSPAAFAICGAA